MVPSIGRLIVVRDYYHPGTHYCRCCGLKMGEANAGYDYRCADCHQKAERPMRCGRCGRPTTECLTTTTGTYHCETWNGPYRRD